MSVDHLLCSVLLVDLDNLEICPFVHQHHTITWTQQLSRKLYVLIQVK